VKPTARGSAYEAARLPLAGATIFNSPDSKSLSTAATTEDLAAFDHCMNSAVLTDAVQSAPGALLATASKQCRPVPFDWECSHTQYMASRVTGPSSDES
jgi:hypothetical protein